MSSLPEFWSFQRSRDQNRIASESLVWRGPFAWTGYEETVGLEEIPDLTGVYLWTYEYKDGMVLRSVGVTNSMRRRFRQHSREYRKGNYTVLDVRGARNGERQEVWHGWGYAREHQDKFLQHKEAILSAVEQELQAFRIFVAEVDDQRKRERIEFAVAHRAWSSREVWGDLIDGGMSLKGRFNEEMPIEIQNLCPMKIYGLPDIMEI